VSAERTASSNPEWTPHNLDATCVHAGTGLTIPGLGMETPPLSPPIFQASVFVSPDLDRVERAIEGEDGLYIYSRGTNPTVVAFEQAMAALEGTEAAVATGSGMGAISAVMLALLKAGDRLVTTSRIYGDARAFFDEQLAGLGVIVEHRSEQALLDSGLPAGTKVLYTETIANPKLEVADLPALASLAHAAGAKLVVDSTFATPIHCRPLALGADLVIHSATKYLGGHGDLMAGVVCGDAETMAKVAKSRGRLGTTCAPQDAWLALRGLRTLHLRMQRHSENALAVAEHLLGHPKIQAVHYPGLAGHGTHGAANRVLAGGSGGMVAFELAVGADESGPDQDADLAGREAFARMLAGFTMIRFAASLADTSTTLSSPLLTSHRGLSRVERAEAGITSGLVRLSCGIEDVGSVLADLERGLGAV
jgi:cystathionine beta-lyase/cystathionine gamma-synthase